MRSFAALASLCLTLTLCACDDGSSPFSGGSSEGSCPPVDDLRLAVAGIRDVEVLTRDFTSLDGRAVYSAPFDDDPVAGADLLLAVSAEVVEVAAERRVRRPAIALSCAGPGVVSVDELASVELTSDADWTGALPAGTSLNGVAVARPAGLPVDPALGIENVPVSVGYASFPAATSGTGVEVVPLSDVAAASRGAPLRLLVRLSPPEEVREHRFGVTWTMADGDTFAATSPPVVVTGSRQVDTLRGTAWELASYSSSGTSVPVPRGVGGDRTGIEIGPASSQIVTREGGGEGGFCEYNVRIGDDAIEFRTETDRDTGVQTNRACVYAPNGPTELQRFFEAFFVGSITYTAAGTSLELTSVTGDSMRFEAVR